MSDFIKLFEDETKATIEALIGEGPSLSLNEEQELSIISNIIPPIPIRNFCPDTKLNLLFVKVVFHK